MLTGRSSNPATTVGTPPLTPAARYVWDGSEVVVSWDAVAEADYYNVYYDDFFSSACTVRRGTRFVLRRVGYQRSGTPPSRIADYYNDYDDYGVLGWLPT